VLFYFLFFEVLGFKLQRKRKKKSIFAQEGSTGASQTISFGLIWSKFGVGRAWHKLSIPIL
jgi:hypothetical protein